ncbi:MAG: hypothetical protein BYD32DRAFT_429386 [Podila humilis]|nr:MAG: hypothetical protein BYD32DRAFT_429386 [Podila humilis]
MLCIFCLIHKAQQLSHQEKKKMSSLIPRCFAANNDTLYFLARADVNTTQGLVVLAKSDPYPASIQEAVWSLVSASNDTIFSTWYNTTYETGDLACNVNDDGVFTFTGQYNGTGRESYRYFTNNSVGEWSAVNLWPGDFFLTPLWSNSTTPDPFILFTPLGLPPDNNNTDFMPTEGKDSTPFMAQFRFEAENNVSTVDNTTLRIGFGSNVSAEWWYRYSTSYLVCLLISIDSTKKTRSDKHLLRKDALRSRHLASAVFIDSFYL